MTATYGDSSVAYGTIEVRYNGRYYRVAATGRGGCRFPRPKRKAFRR